MEGVFNILSLLRAKVYQKPKFIHISTDEVYGDVNVEEEDKTEESILNPSNPYSATKAAAEMLIFAYARTFGINYQIVRSTNNYGPRQFAEKLIPKTIILAYQNKKIPIYGNGKNIRDWIFVDDHCDAVSLALFQGMAGQSYNISANNEINNIVIVKKILDMMDKSEDLIEFVQDRPGHDFRYSMNSKKITDELGWKIKSSFENGLEKTIQWYFDNPEIMNNVSTEILDSSPWKSSN